MQREKTFSKTKTFWMSQKERRTKHVSNLIYSWLRDAIWHLKDISILWLRHFFGILLSQIWAGRDHIGYRGCPKKQVTLLVKAIIFKPRIARCWYYTYFEADTGNLSFCLKISQKMWDFHQNVQFSLNFSII